ncbi:MAG: hypothetical protein LBP87_06955 [Planctomycetaceae bacterium]|jgi:hypothetical protein|nr:hypothetical protein [Planctomycetaceae bacterium]
MENDVKHKKIRISRTKIGCILFISFGLILFLLMIKNLNRASFYTDSPHGKIFVEEDLIGTWELISPRPLFTKIQPSLMILKRDGSYEIHNPTRYLKKFCDSQPKKQFTVPCGLVTAGEWDITTHIGLMSEITFKGIPKSIHNLHGRYPPYQLWYFEGIPDMPLCKWERISKETKCPYCQCSLPVDTGRTHVKHTEFGEDRE